MYHDHHIHPLGYVSLVNGLELMNAASLDEVMTLLVDRAGRRSWPQQPWSQSCIRGADHLA